MKIKILNSFVDIETKENRLIGDEVEITEERFAKLKQNLPSDYFEVVEEMIVEVEKKSEKKSDKKSDKKK